LRTKERMHWGQRRWDNKTLNIRTLIVMPKYIYHLCSVNKLNSTNINIFRIKIWCYYFFYSTGVPQPLGHIWAPGLELGSFWDQNQFSYHMPGLS
jgi:hypothetical protein